MANSQYTKIQRTTKTTEDRRDWWTSVVIAVAFHLLLLVLVLRATPGHRDAPETHQDTPAMHGPFRADSLPVSGVAPQWRPPLQSVTCDYAVALSGRRAQLVQGPQEEPDRLGCAATLPLATDVVTADIEIEYDVRGNIVEMRGDSDFQGANTPAVVEGWDLARPREGRQWRRNPVFRIKIRTSE